MILVELQIFLCRFLRSEKCMSGTGISRDLCISGRVSNKRDAVSCTCKCILLPICFLMIRTDHPSVSFLFHHIYLWMSSSQMHLHVGSISAALNFARTALLAFASHVKSKNKMINVLHMQQLQSLICVKCIECNTGSSTDWFAQPGKHLWNVGVTKRYVLAKIQVEMIIDIINIHFVFESNC